MKRNKKIFIIIIILIISIGFAYLSSNLSISGLVGYKENSWKIFFDNIFIQDSIDSSTENIAINEDKTSIDYSVNLKKPGEKYTFLVDVVNDGTIDAMLDNLEITGLTEEIKKFIDVKVTYADGKELTNKDLLEKKGKVKIKVETSFKSNIEITNLPTVDGSLNFTVSLDYIQADKEATKREVNNISTYLLNNMSKSLVKDTTDDQNLRYIGANPNNYIQFNGELWRIIGVFNNIKDKDDNIYSATKIVRANSIGAYAWDTSERTVNEGRGVNEWSTSKIANSLNNTYYNSLSGLCYIGQFNETTDCDFSENGIKSASKDYIETIKWDTSIIDASINENRTALGLYNSERSGNTSFDVENSAACNDTVERRAIWVGNIGLPSASDFAYATNGSDKISRIECLKLEITSKDYSTNHPYNQECLKENWITFKEQVRKWSMSAVSYNDAYSKRTVFHFSNVKNMIHLSNTGSIQQIYPTLHLKNNVIIMDGSGTEDNPYIISLSN